MLAVSAGRLNPLATAQPTRQPSTADRHAFCDSQPKNRAALAFTRFTPNHDLVQIHAWHV